MFLSDLIRRRQRLKAYRRIRADLEALNNNDLADIGLKRYQLGHVARVKALREARLG